MDKILDDLYKMSEEIHGYINGCGKFAHNLFWSKGKLYDNEEEAYELWNEEKPSIRGYYDEEGNFTTEVIKGGPIVSNTPSEDKFEMYDCRSSEVDEEVKKFINSRMYVYIDEFYKKRDDNDEFFLFLGFTINLYYIIGLYSAFGKFDIIRALDNCDETVKEYASLINDYIYSLILEMIHNNIQDLKMDNPSEYNERIKETNSITEEELKKLVNEVDYNYIPDLVMMINEKDYEYYAEDILEEMLSKFPQYRFGWIYRCIEAAVNLYTSKGEVIDVYEYRNKIGSELYYHILGIKSLDHGKFEYVDGEFKTIRPAMFSEYGIGIPKIKTKSKDSFYANIVLSENESNRRKTTLKEIRTETAANLKIDFVVPISDNPFEYMAKLFEVVENQKETLQSQNTILNEQKSKLEEIQEKRKEMMDYYAHSWKHISYPQIVKEIAEELGKTNRKIANRLMKAYNSERTLQRGIQLLQYISSGDETKVSVEFRNGVAKYGSNAENNVEIHDVICDSLDLVVFKLLMVESDDSNSAIKCREKWNKSYSLEKLSEEYANLFLDGDDSSNNILKWVQENLMNLSISISEEWKGVRFQTDSFALNQFKEILVEIITNIFLHGKDEANIFFESNYDEMIITETNNCDDMNSGSQSGIATMKKVLDYLNIGTGIESLESKLDNEYTLTIRLSKKLLVRKGR